MIATASELAFSLYNSAEFGRLRHRLVMPAHFGTAWLHQNLLMHYSIRNVNILGGSSISRLIVWLTVLVCLCDRVRNVVQTIKSDVSFDEFQHSHTAWMVYSGKILYKDFWDNHGPLYADLNAIFLRFFTNPASLETYSTLRIFPVAVILGTSVAVFFLAKKLRQSSLMATIAMTVYLSWEVTVARGTEIRPDGLQNLFFVIGFYCLVYSLTSIHRPKIPAIMCGMFWGLMIATNLKSGIGLIGLFFFYFYMKWSRKIEKAKLVSIFKWVSIALLFVVGSYSLVLIGQGSMLLFLEKALFDSFVSVSGADNSIRFTIGSLFEKNGQLTALGLLGAVLYWNKSSASKAMLFSMVPMAWAFGAMHSQYCLLFLPFLSLFVSSTFEGLEKAHEKSIVSSALMVLLLVFLFGWPNFASKQKPRNQKYVKSLEWILNNTDRDEVIARRWDGDCMGAATFNPHMGYLFRPSFDRDLYFSKLSTIAPKYIVADYSKRAPPLEISESYEKLAGDDDCIWVRKSNH